MTLCFSVSTPQIITSSIQIHSKFLILCCLIFSLPFTFQSLCWSVQLHFPGRRMPLADTGQYYCSWTLCACLPKRWWVGQVALHPGCTYHVPQLSERVSVLSGTRSSASASPHPTGCSVWGPPVICGIEAEAANRSGQIFPHCVSVSSFILL